MRDFEKISFKQFAKDVKDDKDLYESYILPTRSSKSTAGYDFHLIEDLTIKPGEIVKVPTGVKSFFGEDETLLIIDRSKTGFKYNIRMVNQVGVVDADYYNNPDNEGHLFFKVQNEGTEEVSFKAGDAVVQGLFMKYLTTDSDLRIEKQRSSEY